MLRYIKNHRMDLNTIKKWTVKQLKEYCQTNNITIKGKKNKQELLELISSHINNDSYEFVVDDDDDDNPYQFEKMDIEEDIKIDIQNVDGLTYLKTIADNSINLVLTDPPYIISKDSGMNKHYNNVKDNVKNNVKTVKTVEDWEKYKEENDILDDTNKSNYIKYGTIYGTKYCVQTVYGEWDNEFTIEILDTFIGEYYKKLKKGGTMIIFFDLWKITVLKDIMEKHNFKQIRFLEWIKTNPQPRNSKVNYLTNCREIALLGIKESNPTFNSSYDNAIYSLPLQGGKGRFHPTQKSLVLFEQLIEKHSNKYDVVLDTFLGSGTTALACKNTSRHFKGCEISKEYYDQIRI